MDKIFLQKMHFYAYHGVLPEENRLGQRFQVDLELFLDLASAGATDDLQKTINYAEVYEAVRQEVEGHKYMLLEKLADQIAHKLLKEFAIEEVLVRVTKPDPPIPGHYQAVGVEIKRHKA
ncbi:dihydroneopterin aldolase [Risungbinella massiliensis]|uniref:dihydroneopterin aldolase n=1 Tax=Risungbinella massiliensis TaxID=1329796 RepID=UPI0005CBF114|nr:dihydroneopterin aldolase [Risungbinella massiliensis]